MSVHNLRSWKHALRNLLDSDMSAEFCITWLCSAFQVQRNEVVREWNNLLCKKAWHLNNWEHATGIMGLKSAYHCHYDLYRYFIV